MTKLPYIDETIKLKVPVTVVREASPDDIFQGDYEVTPKTMSEVVLPTKTKIMKDNVTVHKMPQFEVSNEAGGYTLILGDEYYE